MKYLLTHVDQRTGTASIRISEGEGDNEVVKDRRSIAPGSWDATGKWVATDIATIPQEVRADVIKLWSAGAITAYRTANPYAPPVPLTPAELKQVERRSNPAAKTLRNRLLNATDAQIDAYVEATPAKQVLAQILKIIAADMREE